MKRIRRVSNSSYRSLEQRRLLAGDVSVFAGDNLYIRGDDASNQINIIATESGEIEIQGLYGTTINGSADVFKVSNAIDLGGQHSRNAAISGGLNIAMRGGHDRVDVQGLVTQSDTWVSTGDGNDFFRFHKSSANEDFRLLTGHGHDEVRFFQTRATGDFATMTDAGDDFVQAWNSRLSEDVMMHSGEGHDEVIVKHTHFLGDNHEIMTAGGNDEVDVANNDVSESGLSIQTGEGNDVVSALMSAEDIVLGEIQLDGQEGMDALFMSGSDDLDELLSTEGFEEDAKDIVFDRTGAYDNPVYNNYLDTDIIASHFAADYFVLEEDATVSTIDWRGSYSLIRLENAPEVDSFTIKIYENTFIDDETVTDEPYDAPEFEPFVTYEIGNDVTRTETGLTWEGNEEHGNAAEDIYQFSADIDGLELEGGKRYWISIYANIDVDKTGNYDYLFRWGAEATGEFNRETSYSRLYQGIDYWYTSLFANAKFDFMLRT